MSTKTVSRTAAYRASIATGAEAPETPRELVDRLGADAPHEPVEPLDTAARGGSFDPVAAHIRTWLRHWESGAIPAFEAVRDAAPSASLANALRAGATRADGAVRATASVYDPPTGGRTLSWSRNWAAELQLPPAREDGRLYYRFRVGSRLLADGAAELSRVTTSVHFGIVADSRTASPFDAPGFATPTARPLVDVRADDDLELDASELVEGSLDVRAGATPAIAFVLGIDLQLRDGWARLHEGTSSWIGPAEPGASGSIEYRYAPASLLRFFDPATAVIG
ncbi:hypothetical protein [Agromyces seonyuensis]|uniref:Uncharacterized protein n=1 Tax=Agromyces seonyuensis TaxID=2662446 RepID=A0A6I4NXP8_9MICO|nr:hypothetical protein [Agromyces seonyuensis]MWB99130.1 hypothetical protein [Agromyces seonyuensis]